MTATECTESQQHDFLFKVAKTCLGWSLGTRREGKESQAPKTIPAEVKLFFVAPKDGRPGLHNRFGEHVMQVHHLVSAFVAYDDKDRTLLLLDAVFHQRPYTTVDLLSHDA